MPRRFGSKSGKAPPCASRYRDYRRKSRAHAYIQQEIFLDHAVERSSHRSRLLPRVILAFASATYPRLRPLLRFCLSFQACRPNRRTIGGHQDCSEFLLEALLLPGGAWFASGKNSRDQYSLAKTLDL